MKPRLNLVRLFALGMTGLTWAGISDAAALDYPTRPVRWVVGYPAGGTTDILARLIGQYLSEKLGQQFIVENKPGAGNNIATEAVINSPPDGYTLLFVNPANGINTSLYKKLLFDFLRDIAPIAGIARVPNVMEVNPNVPAKTVAEFIAYAKANPDKVNLASSGNGTSVHLSGRTVHGDDRGQADPRALSRLRASAHRHDRRHRCRYCSTTCRLRSSTSGRASCAHSR